ncbi:MAG: 3-deoxy-manno-octulosonate-8-phosphatase KdsC [Spirochaetia bacterium]|nr:3-deoxy-manno-octulosonate-8-phosphatase KdsC [Spirochaetia bacterium]
MITKTDGRLSEDFIKKAREIRLAAFDVDGIMTDGSLYLGDNGEEIKAFHSLDGHGLKMLKASGIDLAIITARTSELVKHRAENIGVSHIYQGAENKLDSFQDLLQKLNLKPSQVAYMGDDLVDLPVLTRCGLSICVPHSPEEVKKRTDLTTSLNGGHGAVREFCDLLMLAQGSYEEQLKKYLE